MNQIKNGILHDYDLMANAEPSAQGQACLICGKSPVVYQWSDLSGEAMCNKCGAAYQLKWGSKKQELERNYPYFNLKKEIVEPLRTYHEETGRFTCLGWMLGEKPGLRQFADWLKKNRPKAYKELTGK